MADVLTSIVDSLNNVFGTLGEQLNGVISTSSDFFTDNVGGETGGGETGGGDGDDAAAGEGAAA